MNRYRKSIVSTKIFVEWNDNPKMELLMNDMPNELAELWDEWLSDIENEENAKNEKTHKEVNNGSRNTI